MDVYLLIFILALILDVANFLNRVCFGSRVMLYYPKIKVYKKGILLIGNSLFNIVI